MVLVGGASRRMGVDKASLVVGGRPLAGRVADALESICTEVLLGGRPVEGVAGRVVPDAAPGGGPLAGLVAAAGAARTPLLVAAACDMPSVVPGLVAHLARRLAEAPDHGAVLCRSAAGIEPFPVALRTARAAALGAALGAGRLALRDALARLDPLVVEPAEWGRFDPEGASFVNWNSPGDVRQAAPAQPRMPGDG